MAAAARRDGRDRHRRDGRHGPAGSRRPTACELNPGQVQMVRELATLRSARATCPSPRRHRQDHRHACAVARVEEQLNPTAHQAAPPPGTSSGSHRPRLPPRYCARKSAPTPTTLAKLIHALETGINVPDWVTAIGPQTLVVIDEAGMAGTVDLAKAIDYVTDRGGSVRLVGDDQQLAAIGAGGVLRDIAGTHGAVTLSQVMRFTHPAGHPQTGAPNHAEGAALARAARRRHRRDRLLHRQRPSARRRHHHRHRRPPTPSGPPTGPPATTRSCWPPTPRSRRRTQRPRPTRPPRLSPTLTTRA